MKVYICDVSSVPDSFLTIAKSYLSETELCRLENMFSQKRQREYILGHYLLRQVVASRYNKSLQEVDVVPLKSGALTLKNQELGYVSLSHSNGFIAIASSSTPVGIDMELIKPKDNYNQILEQIDAVKQARELLNNGYDIQTAFFQLWTKREAVYKLNSLLEKPYQNMSYSYYKTDSFMLCVAAVSNEQVLWEKIDLKTVDKND